MSNQATDNLQDSFQRAMNFSGSPGCGFDLTNSILHEYITSPCKHYKTA